MNRCHIRRQDRFGRGEVAPFVDGGLLGHERGGPRAGDVPAAAELYRQFIAVAERHPQDRSLLIYRALIAWYLVMCYVDHDAMDLAVGIYHDAARLAREHPELPLARVEHAKCATELIQPCQQRGDLRAAAEIVRDAEASLRSPEYLAAREQDLGQAPEEFLDQLDQLLAAAPEDLTAAPED
jgi:hypothetical protein